jgi:hypothetical protein
MHVRIDKRHLVQLSGSQKKCRGQRRGRLPPGGVVVGASSGQTVTAPRTFKLPDYKIFVSCFVCLGYKKEMCEGVE